MDRIRSREELEKSKKKKVFWVSVIMLGLLVTSTAGFAFLSGGSFGSSGGAVNTGTDSGNPSNQNIDYGDVLDIDENITSIPVDIENTLYSYSGVNLYIASDDDEALGLIGSALSGYASKISIGCYGACEEDLPEKICSDDLIVYRESNVSRIYQNQSCIFIEGDLDSVRAFVYKLSGVT